MSDAEENRRPIGRKLTRRRVELCRLAEQTAVGDITRGELAILAQALPCTGLINGTESHLLVTLINTATKESFGKNGRPIVYKSNKQLAFEIHRSEGRVSRLLSRLFDGGFIAMQDSANYKRYPVQNEHGEVVSGCGIDLRVLIARYGELSKMVDDAKAERRKFQAALRRFRGIRRSIEVALERLEDLQERPRQLLESRFRTIVALLGRTSHATSDELERATALLRRLLERIFGVPSKDPDGAEPASEDENTTCVHAVFDTHKQNTTPHQSVNRNERWRSANAEQLYSLFAGFASKKEPDKRRAGQAVETNGQPPSLPALEVVVSACPSVSEFLGGPPRSWEALIRSIPMLCAAAGVSIPARDEAMKSMGQQTAAVAIALMLERHSRGEVHSPGGFLRALTDRALRGELFLTRSIYAVGKRNLVETTL
ncbi:plasmid replication protein RepC [Notoacmeibacter sp. MSK16QG-6]|uniref:plasmid replication protein RepC n=1 Tax=Notoacmeibacter sp. MSK16QG-6 TaxID=2957982 RepID=UPI0020A0BF40|nr:plasmid replication protein RepC [Notoacmeibacter sp. MSK16QG-6]MCP1201068.1 replication initiation protein RepC [Notoacmeibacter sp. MSK16QG-6]